MSHIVEMETEFKDEEVIRKACDNLGLEHPVQGKFNLFSNQTATGLGLKLPGWRFPVVIDTETGKIQFDNYGGSWGSIDKFNAFKQQYASEKVKAAALKARKRVTQKTTAEGGIRLTIHM